jgi:hydrogenase-4 component F
MAMHSLTKSGIFFAVGHISQIKGTQKIADIKGLTQTHPWLGWSLVIGVVAIAGLPPFGIFMSEFLVVSSTFAREPLLAIPLVLGILVALGALFMHLNNLAFGEPTPSVAESDASYVPMIVHFGLVLAAGIFLPSTLVSWFRHVAEILG